MTECSISLESRPLHNDLMTVKRFFLLCLPLIFLASSHSIASALNGLFLGNYSTSVLQAHAVGNALIAVFQSTCIRMSSEAQIFISQASNTKNENQVGVYLWQMIWLSLLSIVITLPIGIVVSNFYFDSTSVQQEAKEYFRLFMLGNFLFPLSAALSSFYSGRDKQKVLLAATGGYILVHTLLAKFMIAGFGLKGAAFSHIASQFLYCLVFFIAILRKKNRLKYGTNQWKIKLKPLFVSMRVGIFNGLSAALMTLSWTVIVKMVATKGDDYLTIVAFGNTCASFLSFLNLGVGQAISIKASGLIGKKDFNEVWILVRSAIIVILIILSLLLFPMVLFPDYVLSLFFSDYPTQFSKEMCDMLRMSCCMLWFFELVGGVDRITRGLLTAIGDTIYMFLSYILLLSFGCCVPIYFALNVIDIFPGAFWGVMSLTILLRNVPLFFRLKKEFFNSRELLVS